MSRTFYIRTFGCQMNVHDSEKLCGIMERKGFLETDNPRNADIIIFNTCSIRQKAEQKFYSELGRVKSCKRRHPHVKIAVAGCIAQQEGKNLFRKASHVDLILGPQNLHVLGDWAERGDISVATRDNPFIALQDIPAKRFDTVKAWVTIMYGCNNFCTYCIVPYTRGRERSRPSERILSEVLNLGDQGYKEITLLGQNVNSYRSDIDFPGLLGKLDMIPGIERIRFITSHPRDLSDELIEAMYELPKVCEQIHLPLQSGSDRILKLMNRGYTYKDYLAKVERIRKRIPGISITTDIIAGFPSEKDEDHSRTLKALDQIKFDGIFAFKFSPRPGTKAALMPESQPEIVKSERLTEILDIQDEITERINRSLKGTVQEVLIEGPSKTDIGKVTGRTRTNKIVNISDPTFPHGEIAVVEISCGRKHSLEGIPVRI
ncbi:MAG: tRNA (N6-isopentenyl adenosine(37)-C2)-methylthiotransferase MiaB [Nitrospirota bacterium]